MPLNPVSTPTEVLKLQQELEARDRTIAVLIRRVENDFASRPSPMAVLEQNISLEQALQRQSGELEHSHGDLVRTLRELKEAHSQLLESKKLEAVGQLAAGVAHEINTPIQYVSDNTNFLKEAVGQLVQNLDLAIQAAEELGQGGDGARLGELREQLRRGKLDWLKAEIPLAFEQSLDGLSRVASIVAAMKDFSHPSADEKQLVDLHEAIQTTITVARNEWKYVADLSIDFDPGLPLVPGLRNELNQVFLNLIVNAAHAIGEQVAARAGDKGLISISTHCCGDEVEIRVRDTGVGIPEGIRARVYDPFFTTKPVGKGTGQGLAIARSVVVDKHGGSMRLETDEGVGTCFFIRLPLEERGAGSRSTRASAP